MNKNKNDCALLKDYVSLYKILNFCTFNLTAKTEMELDILNLKEQCVQTISSIENVLKNNGLYNFSFLVLKQNLMNAAENTLSLNEILFSPKQNLENSLKELTKISKKMKTI